MIRKRVCQLFSLSFIFFLLVSCEKFSGDQTIPSYLSLDSIRLQTDYAQQGTESHSITDGWIYVDGELIGAFQLPATFPVLKEGLHKVVILPGIKKNGIAATRVSYPFFSSIEQNITLVPDSTIRAGIVKTTYLSTTKFLWKEDFEDVAISLDTTSRSDLALNLTPTGSSLTFEGGHSGIVEIDSSGSFFECATHKEYVIPYAPVYLEMNFNTNNKLTVGVIISGQLIYLQVPIITLVPTNGTWKKIYIDLTTTLNAYPNTYGFKVYLATFKDSDVDHSIILMDNFKLVSR